ncbi:MAG: hypothetical protein EOP22_00600 [Hyphomicrobiales bacterium]|nr:MAG: hypothetical protein EOP22_00600 [Hyphomicrobiales bacterium]
METFEIITLALMALGFFPLQALRSRRVIAIVGAMAVAALAATLVFMHLVTTSTNEPQHMSTIGGTVILATLAVCVIYGCVCGALTRYLVLWQASMTLIQSMAVTVAAFALFAYVGWAGWLNV